MLTQEKIIALGFAKRQFQDNTYFYNTGLCLFPSSAGVWILGWDFGVPVAGNFDSEFIPYITTESELRSIIAKLNHHIPLNNL